MLLQFFLRVLIGSYTDMEYSLFLCVLGIALSVASVPIASNSVASSIYVVLLTVLTIVHFDGTSIDSLHNIQIPALTPCSWMKRSSKARSL